MVKGRPDEGFKGFNMNNPLSLVPKDRGICVRCWYEQEHSMSFRVFDVIEWSSPKEGEPQFELGDGGSPLPFSEWGKADWEIDGYLKWDGCINWQTNPHVMYHGCSPEMIDQLKDIFSIVYAIGGRYLKDIGGPQVSLPEECVEIIDGADEK
jgi:hypothetical protein